MNTDRDPVRTGEPDAEAVRTARPGTGRDTTPDLSAPHLCQCEDCQRIYREHLARKAGRETTLCHIDKWGICTVHTTNCVTRDRAPEPGRTTSCSRGRLVPCPVHGREGCPEAPCGAERPSEPTTRCTLPGGHATPTDPGWKGQPWDHGVPERGEWWRMTTLARTATPCTAQLYGVTPREQT